MKKLFTINNLTSCFFYFSILLFLIGFNFTDAPPPSGWYQQFMPNIGGRSITDIFFLDSLTGWSVTNATNQATDTTFVLKTTDGGDNWVILYRKIQTGGGFPGLNRVYFRNQNTGFICGVTGVDKSTNGGFNWFSLNAPNNSYDDMNILNEDTIWIATGNPFTAGIYRTTNGGISWQQQLSAGSYNPDRIYMHNGRFGFADANGGIALYRTTNSGLNWNIVPGIDGFRDIHFIDTLTGWKCSVSGGFMKKTTNSGLNWSTQILPQGGIIQSSGISNFSNINDDTIWGNGGYVLYPNNQVREFLHRTTNGGTNWLFQIPDTSIQIGYRYVDFINKLNGWCYYNLSPTGIHTVTGGGDSFYVSVKQLSSKIPAMYYLELNYPNPFNPSTKIVYGLKTSGHVQIAVYDISGKELVILTDKVYKPGIYEAYFDGNHYSSGVYFYSLIIDGRLIDTKKMVLLK